MAVRIEHTHPTVKFSDLESTDFFELHGEAFLNLTSSDESLCVCLSSGANYGRLAQIDSDEDVTPLDVKSDMVLIHKSSQVGSSN